MQVKYDDEIFDVLDQKEELALTKEQLLQAIYDFGCDIARSRRDGGLMIGHFDDRTEYELFEDNAPAPTR
jgi:hypothetical protein